MRISELVERLEEIQAEHGDLTVQAYAYGDITCMPIDPPTVERNRADGDFVMVQS